MKGIYVTNYNLCNSSGGVVKKILSQINTFKQHGYEVDIYDINSIEYTSPGFVKRNMIALTGNACPDMNMILLKVLEKCSEEKIEFIYIRKVLLDKRQISTLSKIKEISPDTKIMLEIATYPYDSEVQLYKYLILINDKIARKKLPGCVDRIVTFSKDTHIFGVPTLRIMNGVDYNSLPVVEPKKHNGINVVAVALFAKWHGYDRFLNGMVKNSELVKENNINLHLVGRGRILKQYKRIVEKNGLGN